MRRARVVEESEERTVIRVGANVEVVVTQDHVTVKERGRRVFRRNLNGPRLGKREPVRG